MEEPINPTEVRKERTSACSQKRSVPAKAKHKRKEYAQNLLVRGPYIQKGQAQGEIAC